MNRTFLILLMIGTAMMIAVIGQRKPVNSLDYMPWEVDLLKNGSTRVLGITLGKTTIQEANQIFASFAQTRLIRNNTSLSDSVSGMRNPVSEHTSTDATSAHIGTLDTGNQAANADSTGIENTDTSEYQLIARYNDLNFDGIIAEVQLTYQLDRAKTLELRNKLKIDKTAGEVSIAANSQVDSQADFLAHSQASAQEYEIDKQDEISLLSTPVAGITFIPSIDYGEDTIRQRFGQAAKQLKINDNEQQWSYPESGLKIFIYADRPDHFVYSK